MGDAGQTLFFGIGAQKSGTSWLHRYLNQHPEVLTSGVKETDFFWTIQNGEEQLRAAQLIRQMSGSIVEAKGGHRLRPAARPKRVGDLACLTGALLGSGDYLSLYAGRGPEYRAFGEISPSYALLDSEIFARMGKLTSNVRFFFIMRDPVKRFWSSIRMLVARQPAVLEKFGDVRTLYFDRLSQEISHPVRMTQYGDTMRRLEAAVDPSQIHYMFYEDLFSRDETRNQATLSALDTFLAIPGGAADFGKRVWETDETRVKVDDLDAEMTEAALRRFGPVYVEMAEKFGDRLPPEWQKTYQSRPSDRAAQ